jgi:hypothetical protein
MLYIRVRFADQTTDPQTLADAQTMLSSVDSFSGRLPARRPPSRQRSRRFTPGGDTAYYITNDICKLRTDVGAAKAGGYDSVN